MIKDINILIVLLADLLQYKVIDFIMNRAYLDKARYGWL